MTSKLFSRFALGLALLTSLSACSLGKNPEEVLVKVEMTEASFLNLYGASETNCVDVAGNACE
ncbi:hypothetical protein [uncultured Lentibacter sp.]|jgi:hypothetical protein|uniref:hypothetical protein n=1 Tax=uncultured Lentibacter sp. TaxID=1659309 RepID=UPI002604F4F6|nr:hypothetical protein [uncultured Lentibacter sp.]